MLFVRALLIFFFLIGFLWIVCFLLAGLRRESISASRARQRRRDRQPLSLRVLEQRAITEHLLIVKLVSAAGEPLPVFQPGQYLTVQVQTEVGGPVWRRCYSLAAWQRRPRYYELCIKNEPDGRISQWLHAHLRQDAHINALPPRGRFVLSKQSGRRLVLVAGGVGIAPLRAMLHSVMAQGAREPVTLFYSARYRQQLCYLDEFMALENKHPNFSFHAVISRPGKDWQGMRGRLSAKTLLQVIGDPEPCQIYLCGPPAMLNTLEDGLLGAGFDPLNLFCERFLLEGNMSAEGDFKIGIEDGTAFWFQNQHTLLEALEEHGIDVESECRTGACGVCRIHLLNGEVHELVKPGVPLESREILPCCCIPRSNLKLSVGIP